MCGGKRDVFDRCTPVFEAMGKTIVYCGPSGSGQIVKLCNQVIVGLNNLAMCEALVLARKAGVEPATMLQAVSAGAASSWALQNLGPRMLQGDFKPGFKVAHQQKDLRLALELAQPGLDAAARHRARTPALRRARSRRPGRGRHAGAGQGAGKAGEHFAYATLSCQGRRSLHPVHVSDRRGAP